MSYYNATNAAPILFTELQRSRNLNSNIPDLAADYSLGSLLLILIFPLPSTYIRAAWPHYGYFDTTKSSTTELHLSKNCVLCHIAQHSGGFPATYNDFLLISTLYRTWRRELEHHKNIAEDISIYVKITPTEVHDQVLLKSIYVKLKIDLSCITDEGRLSRFFELSMTLRARILV